MKNSIRKRTVLVIFTLFISMMIVSVGGSQTSQASASTNDWILTKTITMSNNPVPYGLDYDNVSGLVFVVDRNGQLTAYNPNDFVDGQTAYPASLLQSAKFPDDCQRADGYGDVYVSPDGTKISIMDASGELYLIDANDFSNFEAYPPGGACKTQYAFRGIFADNPDQNLFTVGTTGVGPGVVRSFDANIVSPTEVQLDQLDSESISSGQRQLHWIGTTVDGSTLLVTSFNSGGAHYITDVYFVDVDQSDKSLTFDYSETEIIWPMYRRVFHVESNFNRDWAYLSYQGGVLAYDIAGKEKLNFEYTGGTVYWLSYNSEPDMLIGVDDNTVFFFDPETLQLIGQGTYDVPGAVRLLHSDISKDGTEIYLTDRTGGVLYVLERENGSPEVDAGGPYSGVEGSSIVLNQAAATDSDGDSLTYAWTTTSTVCSFVDPTLLHTTVTCTDDGNFDMTLAVSDGYHDPVPDTADLDVSNVAPTANFEMNPDVILITQSSVATFSNQFDPSTMDTAAGFTYEYDCDNDGLYEVTSAFPTQSCTFYVPGTHTVHGRISDDLDGTPYSANILVQTPAERCDDIVEELEDYPLPNSSGYPIAIACDKLSDKNPKNDKAAVGAMEATIQQIESQAGKKLTQEEADYLIGLIEEVLAILNQ